MRVHRALALALALSCAPGDSNPTMLPVAAPPPSPVPHGPFSVELSLTDAQGQPLSAKVAIASNFAMRPLWQGEHGVDGVHANLPGPGLYQITIEAEGHEPRALSQVLVGPTTISGAVSEGLTFEGLDAEGEEALETARAWRAGDDDRRALDEASSLLPTRDGRARVLLRLFRFDALARAMPESLREAEARFVLSEVDPSEPYLAATTSLIAQLSSTLPNDPELLAFLNALKQHSDRALAAEAYVNLLDMADALDDFHEVERLYAELQDRESLHQAGWYMYAREKFDPQRILRVGAKLPAFELARLSANEAPLRSESLRGRPYLLEFWGVGCEPCEEAMPELHRVHETLNGQQTRVEFVFVSINEGPEVVQTYRREQWPMPWTHALEPDLGALQARFGILGIPTTVLVGPDGTILADGARLRDERLLETLERLAPPLADH